MTMGSKSRLLAFGAACLVSACAPRRTDLGSSVEDAATFYVAPDAAVSDGSDDLPAVPDADDARDAGPTDLGPPCLVGGTSALLPVTLGCSQAPPGRVVVAGDYVYWTVQGAGAIVLRAPLNGGGPEALATDFGGAFGLVIDDRFVYYTQPARGRVMRVPLAGNAEPLALARIVAAPFLLASDGKSLYWTSAPSTGAGLVQKLDLAPESVPVTLADGQSQPRAIAVRDGFVYWTDFTDGSLLRTEDHLLGPADAGIRTVTRLASGLKNPSDLLLVGEFAYVPDRAGHIVRVPLAGGEAETVADVDGQPYGLATDGAVLYWSVLGTDSGIFTGPLTPSGGKGTRAIGGQPDPHFLAVTNDNVYWAAWGPRPSLRRLPR